MKQINQKKKAMLQHLPEVGALIEKFRLETGTTFEVLTDDTGVHYNTYKKLMTGDPTQRSLYLLLVVAYLMQRDHNGAASRFFNDLRSLLRKGLVDC